MYPYLYHVFVFMLLELPLPDVLTCTLPLGLLMPLIQVKKILNLLRLRQIGNATFLRVGGGPLSQASLKYVRLG